MPRYWRSLTMRLKLRQSVLLWCDRLSGPQLSEMQAVVLRAVVGQPLATNDDQ